MIFKMFKKTTTQKVEMTIAEKLNSLNQTGREVVITSKTTTTTHYVGCIVEITDNEVELHNLKKINVNTIKAVDVKKAAY